MFKYIGKSIYSSNNTLIFGETQYTWTADEQGNLSVNKITDNDLSGVAHIFIAEHYAGNCVGETIIWEHEFLGSFALAVARLLTYDYEISFEDSEPPKHK